MNVDDFTYEHQIINQAKHLIERESQGKIDDVDLKDKSIFSMKILGNLIHSNKTFKSSVRFKEMDQIINDCLNSKITQKELSGFSKKLIGDLSEVKSDSNIMKDILDQVEFLILISFMDCGHKLDFIDQSLLESLIEKLSDLKINDDYLSLFETYDDKYDENVFPQRPGKKIIVEALLQLKLNQLVESGRVKKDFYRKIKIRKLFFIKEVHAKLDLLKDNSIFKPSSQRIYEIVTASSVLILLSYNKTISLNDLESKKYLDKEIDSKMIESEIHSRIERERNDLLTFNIPIPIIQNKFRVPLFLALLVYVIIWAFFSVFLYYHVFSGYYWDIIFIALLIYTAFLLYQSYAKTYGKKNKTE